MPTEPQLVDFTPPTAAPAPSPAGQLVDFTPPAQASGQLVDFTPPDQNDVGALESAGRGWITANAQAGKVLGLAAAAPAVLYDKIKNALGGDGSTAASDYAFKNWVDPYQNSIDRYKIQEDEKQSLAAKVAGGLGGLAADLPLIIASGGATAPAQLARVAPTTAEYVGEALHRGFDAMRPVMVKSGAEKAEEVEARGGTVGQALGAGTTAAMLAGFQGAAPMSIEGNILTRAATGVPVGAATGWAANAVQNAAMPAGMEHQYTPEEGLVAGLTGGVMAGAMGHGGEAMPYAEHAAAVERIKSSGLPVHEQLQAIRALNPEPVATPTAHIAPSEEILGAQSVDEAIAAAKVETPAAVWRPRDGAIDSDVADHVVEQVAAEAPPPVPVTKRLISDRGVDAEGQPWEHTYRAAANPDGTFSLERVANGEVQRLSADGTWSVDGAPETFKTLKFAAEAAMEQKAAQPRDGGAHVPSIEAPRMPEFNDIQPERQPPEHDIYSVRPENREAIIGRATDRALARIEGKEVEPLRRESTRLTLDRELRKLNDGKITTGEFVNRIDALSSRQQLKAAEADLRHAPRERGADYVRERLLQAKRRGDVTEEAADMAEWFILKNPALLDQLGVSMRTPGENVSTAGTYHPLERVMTIMKGGDKSTVAVHEMLHHLERLMPEDMQRGIHTEYLRSIAAELKKKDPVMTEYLTAILRGDRKSLEQAAEMVKSSKVPYEAYQFMNPSEFWAVSMTRTAEARFRAQGLWAKTRQWLTEALQHVKGALRMSSEAPMLRALNEVIRNGDGQFRSENMLAEGSIFHDIPAGPAGEAPRRMKKLVEKIQGIGLVKKAMDVMPEIINELQMKLMPMSAHSGSDTARALAKDYANAERNARLQWAQFDAVLTKHYTAEERKAMWEAADEQNVLMQQGLPTAGKGLDRLNDGQKATMEVLHKYGEELLQRAKDAGMFKGEGLPYWAPRIAVMIGENGEYSAPPMRGEGGGTSDVGRNVSTNAASLKQRKYLTTEETETALKAALGENAAVVRDIRTMPMAMARMERAVAARELVNGIKDVGRKLGTETVSDSERPDFFTIDHPAFKTFRPRLIENADGKMVAAHDENGDLMFDKVPIYVAKEFEGPLKSIMSEKSGRIYNGFMALKGAAMSVIMYSPLIHNMVEFGRALPMMPGKMITLQVYRDGAKAKADPAMMHFFVSKGMVPIGHRGGIQDITGVMEDPSLNPGRSWTAKLLGGATGLVNKEAGQAVKRGIDTAGDFWHNTLLWDRIGDLQAGLAVNIYKAETARLMKKGLTQEQAAGTAGYLAAHMANRYAGALPNEAMSAMSRKVANIALFSRSFTLGNIGVMKDMLSGLPVEVRAQIKRDYGDLAARAGTSVARRKAIAAFAVDVALMYVANSALQDVFDMLKRDKTLSDIEQGYVDRFHALLKKGHEDPLAALNPVGALEHLSSTSTNEPGKENRILYDFDKSGTGIYLRLPTGKIGEEFVGWATSPLDMLKRKESTFTRPLMETMTNDKGFGKRVYNPDDKGVAGATRNVGKVVLNFMKAQLPVDAIQGVIDEGRGSADDTTAYKLAGPLAGLTFSKGAPGGPAVGEMYHAENLYRGKKADIMPDVQALIKQGKVDEAVDLMRSIGMPNAEMNTVIRYAEDPAARLSRGSVRRFNQHSDEEGRARMEQQLNRR